MAIAKSRSAAGESSAGSCPTAAAARGENSAGLRPPAGDPPILGATLGGAADGADHWAHTLLNHPDDPHISAAELGRGPRYFRLQVPLTESVPLDQADDRTLTETLPGFAKELIDTHEAEISEIVERLLRFEPLPFDPPPA